MARRRVWLVLGAAVLTAGAFFFIAPSGPRSLRIFDPDRTADLELDMWQAYYDKRNVRLFTDLVTLLHEQNRYSWARATQAGFHLAHAAATFGNLRSEYEQVLPDLIAAYKIERDWLHAGFDPVAVSKAGLAWWVARREAGQNSAEHVGAVIADENALLYEVPRDRVIEASTVRARRQIARR